MKGAKGSFERTGEPLKCLWMTAGVVDYKLCELEYDCENCPFDWGIRGSAPHQRAAMISEQGYEVTGTLFYHPAHIWIRVEEEGRVRIGLDDFGQKLVGRIYAIHLPKHGTNESSWRVVHRLGETILSGGVKGRVLQTNQKLQQHPSLINHDPYGEGWAMIIEPEFLLDSLKTLYYGQRAQQWYREEIDMLQNRIDETRPDVGMTLQDGGAPVDINQLVNIKIIEEFLSPHRPGPIMGRQNDVSNRR